MNEIRYVSGDNTPIFFKIVSLFDDNGNKITNYSGLTPYFTVRNKSGTVLFQSIGTIGANGLIKFPMLSTYTENLKGEYEADIEIRSATSKSTAFLGNTNKITFVVLEDIT